VVVDIDWRRVAEPQVDLSDAHVVDFIRSENLPPYSQSQFVRTPVTGAERVICDGKVGVRSLTAALTSRTGFVAIDPSEGELNAALVLLQRWPTILRQLPYIIDTIYPVGVAGQNLTGRTGSSSTHIRELPGAMFATTYCAIGTATAIVHEMAHQKLHALGIHLENSNALIINDSSDGFESPIRKDKKRPMQAVLHAEYSFMHIVALLSHLIATESRDAKCKPDAHALDACSPYTEIGRRSHGVATLR